MTSLETAQTAIDKGIDGLKQHSMAELNGMYCNIVKAPQAPKFSDKTAAAKRIIKMAEQALANDMERSAESEVGNLTLTPSPAKIPVKVGRPKAKAREYMFLSESSEEHIADATKQARDIHQNMVHNEWIPESEVRIHIEAMKGEGKLVTTQSSWRIFQYYRAQLINRSLLKMRNAE
tara:strand:+ start:7046 stop:7576 length:531 start_codon:yes stop_codon:yes gene_type:complete